MLSYFKLATATLITLITISFAQDVTLSIDGTSLNYESSVGGIEAPENENAKHVEALQEIVKPASAVAPPDGVDTQSS